MSNIDRKQTDRARPTSQKSDDAQRKAATHAEHRLRGDELADDFADADADSCTVTRRRNDKESES